jgi:hypothetical protein
VRVDSCLRDPEDSAERYFRNEMPEEEAKDFERHCDACPHCAAILTQELLVMAMIRTAGVERPSAEV